MKNITEHHLACDFGAPNPRQDSELFPGRNTTGKPSLDEMYDCPNCKTRMRINHGASSACGCGLEWKVFGNHLVVSNCGFARGSS